MKLQPHYFCSGAPRLTGPRGRIRVPRGDVKACYVRIRRRWTRVGTLCLHCRQFVSEL
jgi:hypothetical protein